MPAEVTSTKPFVDEFTRACRAGSERLSQIRDGDEILWRMGVLVGPDRVPSVPGLLALGVYPRQLLAGSREVTQPTALIYRLGWVSPFSCSPSPSPRNASMTGATSPALSKRNKCAPPSMT